jgi:hypothetical protein
VDPRRFFSWQRVLTVPTDNKALHNFGSWYDGFYRTIFIVDEFTREERRTVHLPLIKSLICVSSLIKHLRPEIEIISTNYMPEVISDLSYDIKKLFQSCPKELGLAIFQRPASGQPSEDCSLDANNF